MTERKNNFRQQCEGFFDGIQLGKRAWNDLCQRYAAPENDLSKVEVTLNTAIDVFSQCLRKLYPVEETTQEELNAEERVLIAKMLLGDKDVDSFALRATDKFNNAPCSTFLGMEVGVSPNRWHRFVVTHKAMMPEDETADDQNYSLLTKLNNNIGYECVRGKHASLCGDYDLWLQIEKMLASILSLKSR